MKNRNLVFRLIGVIVLIIVMIFVVSIFNGNKTKVKEEKNSSIQIVSFAGYTGECTSEPYYIDVKSSDDQNVIAYSIDDGATWQEESSFLISENKTYFVRTKDKDGLVSNSRALNINNIDNEGPILEIPLTTVIEKNDRIDLTKHVTVYDKCSNVSSGVEIIPSSIDTSKVGEYDILYRTSDKFGNITEKVRKVIVKENGEPDPVIVTQTPIVESVRRPVTQYRYRVLRTTTSTCGTHDCNCRSTKIDASYICPTGYTLSGTKCIKNVVVDPRTYTCSSGTYDSSTKTCYDKQYYYCADGGIIYNTSNCKYQAFVYDIKYCDLIENGICYFVTPALRYSNYVKVTIPNAIKTPVCPSGSDLINGVCFKKETITATKVCPTGYNLSGGQCVSVEKNDCDTCNTTCTNSEWSEWSEWTTTRYTTTSTRQVETREV